MQSSSKIETTENIGITVTVTATVREWRMMLKQIDGAHPGWILKNEIRDAIARVEKESLGPFLEVPDEQ